MGFIIILMGYYILMGFIMDIIIFDGPFCYFDGMIKETRSIS